MQTSANNFGLCMANALLIEAIAWPSPGLVSAVSNGIHTDMNIFTFIRSATSLLNYFERAYLMGNYYSVNKKSMALLAKQLQKLGCAAERVMRIATNGVNTHKGAIFLGLILSAAAGYQSEVNRSLSQICKLGKHLGRHIVLPAIKKTEKIKQPITTGIKAYLNFGITGIRGEVLSGFRNILKIGLPCLKQALQINSCLRHATIQTLLAFIAHVDDTTILNRKFDINRIKLAQNASQKILNAGGIYTKQGKQLLNRTHKLFIKKSISPGGSADLVAMTLCLYFWRYGYPQGFIHKQPNFK